MDIMDNIKFDDDSDYLTVPDNKDCNFGTDDWTVDFWFTPKFNLWITVRNWFIYKIWRKYIHASTKGMFIINYKGEKNG